MASRSVLAKFGIAAALASPVMAQGQDRSVQFAAEAVRICIDTGGGAPALRQLAAAEGWTATDAKVLAGEHSITVGGNPNVTYRPSNIWTVDKSGLALTILVYDIPKRSKVEHCEVHAWDLNSEAVDRALKSDRRIRGGFFERPGFPMRRYEIKKPRAIFRYGAAEKNSRTLHVLAGY